MQLLNLQDPLTRSRSGALSSLSGRIFPHGHQLGQANLLPSYCYLLLVLITKVSCIGFGVAGSRAGRLQERHASPFPFLPLSSRMARQKQILALSSAAVAMRCRSSPIAAFPSKAQTGLGKGPKT